MDKQLILDLINAARKALEPPHPDAASVNTVVKPDTAKQYEAEAGRIFGRDPKTKEILPPGNLDKIIAAVRKAKTKATLRKYARSVRHLTLIRLNAVLNRLDQMQRAEKWDVIERTVMHPAFHAYTTLAQMMPPDYAKDWGPIRGRKGKKGSLLRLPADWREQLAAESHGQFRVPTIVALMTGCRPEELHMGIYLIRTKKGLYVRIKGAKVTALAGQKFRRFWLADHPLTTELLVMMQNNLNPSRMIVKVEHGNSVTTHMRAAGMRVWPKRKESITCYTARHAMAAACKAAIANGADPDLVSQVLGHLVDKTASYYGNRFQNGGHNVVPSDVSVTRRIRHKQRERVESRRIAGFIPQPSIDKHGVRAPNPG